MKINTVAIIGAGAIGGYFIWGLSESLKDNLWIVADGARKEKLEKDGICINDKKYKLNVKTAAQARGADLLLVATKYGALKAVLDDIAEIVTENTLVLSLLNGVDSEEVIGNRIGMEHMLYSLMKIDAERRESGIVFDGPSTLGVFYGEAGQSHPSERMLAIKELFDETNLHYKMCEDIIKEMWIKYAFNVSKNQPQAMINASAGIYRDSSYIGFISQKLCDEVVAVAAAKGIYIEGLCAPGNAASGSNPKSRYSMLQDVQAKRHTEVDMLAGEMVRMGKKLGVPTPYNEFTYNLIKAIEEKNDGKFDY
jgi:2-dehydropantoate 2-reductase